MLTGDNGILTQAQNAKEKTTKAEEEEKIKMAVAGSSISNDGLVEMLDETSFKNELKNQFGNQELDVVVNGDGSFIITVKDTNRKYYVNDDKTVINSDNIIEINNEEELKTFRDDVNSGNSYEGKAVLLTSNIDLGGEEWKPIGFIVPDTDTKNPETGDNKAFKGIFDGGNHTIKNLKISSTINRFNGLFSFVVDGTIRNITIGKDSEISGSPGAGVVGYLYGFKGNISNCINYANTNRAGIAAVITIQHTIYNCKNYGNITSTTDAAGGILGSSNGSDWPEEYKNYFHKIINCGNYGSVTKESGNYCGGIVGFFKGDIINCCNKAEIQGVGSWTGGVVGNTAGGFTIENCYNTKNVSGNISVGGIIGESTKLEGASNIKNCYSIGEITGTGNVGDIDGVPEYGGVKDNIINCKTKADIFSAEDLGDAFVDDTENVNGGYPLLYWE